MQMIEHCLGFECCHTFVYYFSLLFPSSYCGKKEFFSSAGSRAALACCAGWVPRLLNPGYGAQLFEFYCG